MFRVGDHAWDNCRRHEEAVGASSRLDIYAYGWEIRRETVMRTIDVTVPWATCRLMAPYPSDRMLSRSSHHWCSRRTDSPPPACATTLGMASTTFMRSTPHRCCLPPPSCNTGIAPLRYALRRRSRLPRRRTRDCLARRQAGATRYPPPYDYWV